MPEKSVEELIRLHKAGDKDRKQWRDINRDAYRYTEAARDTIDSPQSGERRHDRIFDSTGARSHTRLANRMQDQLFPSGTNFVELKPGTRFKSENITESQRKQATEQLQEINEKFHAAVWNSNFESAIGEYLRDKTISMGAMLFNEGPEWAPFHFHTVPQFMLNFGEGPWGTIGTVSRETTILPSVAALTWTDSKIPEDEKKKTEDGDKRTYMEITYPDDGTLLGKGQAGSQPTRWYYDVIDMEKRESILKEQRTIEVASHWIVSRWTKAAGEIRGRGPVLEVMPAIRVANKVVELILKNGSLAVGGLWTARDDGVFNPNTSSFSSGSVIIVQSNATGGEGPTIAPLQFPGNFDVSQLILTDLRSMIKQGLHDSDLPPLAGAVHSPTEIVERLRDLSVDIGPTFGRLNRELIYPFVLRGLHILRKKNIIDLPQDFKLDSEFIDIQVVSPLARRKNLDNVDKMVNTITLSTQTVGEQITTLSYKVEDVPRAIAEQLGFPETLVRSPEEKQALQDIMARIAQQQGVAVNEGEEPQ